LLIVLFLVCLASSQPSIIYVLFYFLFFAVLFAAKTTHYKVTALSENWMTFDAHISA